MRRRCRDMCCSGNRREGDDRWWSMREKQIQPWMFPVSKSHCRDVRERDGCTIFVTVKCNDKRWPGSRWNGVAGQTRVLTCVVLTVKWWRGFTFYMVLISTKAPMHQYIGCIFALLCSVWYVTPLLCWHIQELLARVIPAICLYKALYWKILIIK